MAAKKTEFVSSAWIAKQLGIHASSVEIAWRRGDLKTHHFVLGGRNQERPVFVRKDAEKWFKGRAA